MREQQPPECNPLEAELIGAALQYVAVADWFEARPITRAERRRDRKTMDAFNRVEAELRKAGRRLLRRLGHRELVLELVLRSCGLSVTLSADGEEEARE